MAAAVGLGLVAGAVSAFSQYNASKNQAAALDAQAAEQQRQANITGVAGTEAVRQVSKQGAFLRGSQEEAAAGGGVSSTTGSPLAVAQEDAREMKFNELKTQFQFDSQAFSLQRAAQLSSWSAGKVRQTGIINATGSLLTSTAGAYYSGKGGGFGTSDPSSTTGHGGF